MRWSVFNTQRWYLSTPKFLFKAQILPLRFSWRSCLCKLMQNVQDFPAADSIKENMWQIQQKQAKYKKVMAFYGIRIMSTYHWRDLHQCHIIAAEGNDKQHSLNAVKAAEPLPPLTPLTPDIVQPVSPQNKIYSCFIQWFGHKSEKKFLELVDKIVLLESSYVQKSPGIFFWWLLLSQCSS